jgi:hypothetical protein
LKICNLFSEKITIFRWKNIFLNLENTIPCLRDIIFHSEKILAEGENGDKMKSRESGGDGMLGANGSRWACAYRKFLALLDFDGINTRLSKFRKENSNGGYGLPTLFKCLFLQHLENLSDRELEKYIGENVAARWFCGFGLTEPTPNHTVFTRTRFRIGTRALSKIFAAMKNQSKADGYMSEIFTFIDATNLIAKGQLWKERDALIKGKYE